MLLEVDRYYRFIDIDNLNVIQNKVLSLITDISVSGSMLLTFTNRHDKNLFNDIASIKEINEFLIKHNLSEYIMDYVVGILNPDQTMDIHSDPLYTDPATLKTSNRQRVLIPIKNCENTTTSFYISKEKPELRYANDANGGLLPYDYYSEEKCELLAEFKLTNPALITTDVLHGVKNNTDSPRINLWIIFSNEVNLEDHLWKIGNI